MGKYKENLLERLGVDNKIVRLLLNRAKLDPKRVVFAEADQLDVLKAAQIVHEEGIAIPILLGRRDDIERLKEEIEFDADVQLLIQNLMKKKSEKINMLKYIGSNVNVEE